MAARAGPTIGSSPCTSFDTIWKCYWNTNAAPAMASARSAKASSASISSCTPSFSPPLSIPKRRWIATAPRRPHRNPAVGDPQFRFADEPVPQRIRIGIEHRLGAARENEPGAQVQLVLQLLLSPSGVTQVDPQGIGIGGGCRRKCLLHIFFARSHEDVPKYALQVAGRAG